MLISELFEMSDQSFATVELVFKSNFARRGMRILFPNHVRYRAQVGERGAAVQDQRVMEALNKILRLYDAKDARLMGVFEVVRRLNRGVQVVFVYPYDDTAINIPCAIEPDQVRRGGFKVVIKTIMVKPDFKPHSSHDIVINLA